MPFDLERLQVRGDPVPVLEGVVTKISGAVDFDFSRHGQMVYVTGEAGGVSRYRLVWGDRQGREEAIAAEPRAYTYPRISPDGGKAALDVRGVEDDISVWDLSRETLTKLTFGAAEDKYPVWTPGSDRIVFESFRAGGLHWRAANGTGTAELLVEDSEVLTPYSMSSDGKWLIYGTLRGLGALAIDADQIEARPLLDSEPNALNAEISPNGRWLAYESSGQGGGEVWVRPFPSVEDGRWQVSTGGGTEPL